MFAQLSGLSSCRLAHTAKIPTTASKVVTQMMSRTSHRRSRGADVAPACASVGAPLGGAPVGLVAPGRRVSPVVAENRTATYAIAVRSCTMYAAISAAGKKKRGEDEIAEEAVPLATRDTRWPEGKRNPDRRGDEPPEC